MVKFFNKESSINMILTDFDIKYILAKHGLKMYEIIMDHTTIDILTVRDDDPKFREILDVITSVLKLNRDHPKTLPNNLR